ncbi:MAG: 16S rRNA (uracil(1498)-N(3))-methyltransferase [Chitinophagaceae bacterium]|nr:MAG: 16S rRNA (uracil(1498)-N(3))-methyltransferase [Chitinophagaceae bacterium]
MNEQLFFAEYSGSKHIELDEQDSRHCYKVLRKKAGDTIQITDGKGNAIRGVLLETTPRRCVAEVREIVEMPLPAYTLSIGVGMPSHPQRLEWMLEKLTELNVTNIFLLKTERVQPLHYKQERLNKIIISAMKQSLQFYMPALEIEKPLSAFTDFFHTFKEDERQGLSGSCDKAAPALKTVFEKNKKNYFALIGPEGDFTESEERHISSSGFYPISLSNNRLRTETAAISIVNGIHLQQ